MPVALPQRLEELFGIVTQMAADILRLRYRQALSEVIAAIIRSDEPATPDTVSARVPTTVAKEVQAYFVTMALSEFKALHPGNAVRFGLVWFGIGPLELDAWQTRQVER